MNIITYCTNGGKDLITSYLDDLPQKEKVAGYDALEKIVKYGLDSVETRQIEGKLWEIKFYRQRRIFYVVKKEDSIYLLHICKKQKGKAEKFEIKKARKRMKEI